jgi:hypothetical protein
MRGTHVVDRRVKAGRRAPLAQLTSLHRKKTPVGIEPTLTGLQPVAWPLGSSVKYPRQESNLIPDLRRVVCAPPHPEDKIIPARIRTGIQTLEESDVAPLHHQDIQEPTAGFAPA